MEITLNISDEKISDIIASNIDGVPKEVLSEAIAEGIKQYMESGKGADYIKKILFIDYNNYYHSAVDLTATGKEIVKNAIEKVDISDIIETAMNLANDHMREIMVEAVLRIFLKNVSSQIDISEQLLINQSYIHDLVKAEEQNRSHGYNS